LEKEAEEQRISQETEAERLRLEAQEKERKRYEEAER
jgi:hypothetical protein